MSDVTKPAEEHVEPGTAAPITTVTEQPAVAQGEDHSPPPPSDEERPHDAEKYAASPEKQERDAKRAEFAPLRAMIIDAGNGDRVALASVLAALTDLHQGPIEDDTLADHLRAAGAALAQDRFDDAESELADAEALMPAGSPDLGKATAAQDALHAGDHVTAAKLIDELLAAPPAAEAG